MLRQMTARNGRYYELPTVSLTMNATMVSTYRSSTGELSTSDMQSEGFRNEIN